MQYLRPTECYVSINISIKLGEKIPEDLWVNGINSGPASAARMSQILFPTEVPGGLRAPKARTAGGQQNLPAAPSGFLALITALILHLFLCLPSN